MAKAGPIIPPGVSRLLGLLKKTDFKAESTGNRIRSHDANGWLCPIAWVCQKKLKRLVSNADACGRKAGKLLSLTPAEQNLIIDAADWPHFDNWDIKRDGVTPRGSSSQSARAWRRSDMARRFTGDTIGNHMETLLREQSTQGFDAERFNTLVDLNDRMVEFLRDTTLDRRTEEIRNATPAWDKYPLARNWFSQNNVSLKKLTVKPAEAAA